MIKSAATFGEIRNMLTHAKKNNINIIRDPKKYLDKDRANLIEEFSKNKKSTILASPAANKFLWKKQIYLPRQEHYNYKLQGVSPSNVLAHEMGHIVDKKQGGVARHYYRKFFNSKETKSTKDLRDEQRANTFGKSMFLKDPKTINNFKTEV